MKRFVFRILIITFIAITLSAAFMTSIRRATDVRVNAETAHAVRLAHNRLSDARGVFDELRPYFDVLSASDELFQREIYINPRVLFTPTEEELIWNSEWVNIPWLQPEELGAINVMLFSEIEGARDQSIAFSENAMTVTIYATPLHSVTGVSAWLGISYRDSVLAYYPDHEIIMVEPLEGDWHLTIYALAPSNITFPFLIATIILAAVTITFIVVYIWGIRTRRFYDI